MAAKESAAVAAAVVDVLTNGMTRAAAAARHDVAEGSITRALRRRGVAPLPRYKAPRKVLTPLPEPFRFADGTPLTVGGES